MSMTASRTMICGLLFLSTLISGVWLSHSGKPLSAVIVTIHKLISLATVIVIAANIYPVYKAAEFKTFVEPLLVAITGLLTLALFISGAFLSRGNPLPEAILRIHQLAPLLALAFSAMTIYLLISNRS